MSETASESPLSAGLAEIEWTVEASRSGEPTLTIGRRQAHSAYTPRREAIALAEQLAADVRERGAKLLIAVGGGLGYVYQELQRRVEIPVLLWEPFPELVSQVPYEDESWREKLRIVSTPGEYDAALDDYRVEARAPLFFIHPGYEHPARFEARYLAQGLRALQKRDAIHRPRDWVISPRSLDFLCRYPFVHLVEELRPLFEDQTVVVVSAGPSMHLATGALMERSGGIVMAALQAVGPLREVGVAIDFGVIADPKDYSGFIDGYPDPYAALLADSSSDPAILDRALDRTYVYHLQTPHVHESAWLADGHPVIETPTATVSEVSVILAHVLGARQIVLAGVDFASTDERYGVRFRARGRDAEPVWTNSAYFHAARCMDWLCPQIAAEGCEIHRLGDGLPISGTRECDVAGLEALLSAAPGFEPPEPSSVCSEDRWERADALLAKISKSRMRKPRAIAEEAPFADFRRISGSELRRGCADARVKLEKTRSISRVPVGSRSALDPLRS